MWSLERKPHPLDFYIRRFFRIYPLSMVAVMCIVIFRIPVAADAQQVFAPYYHNTLGVIENLLLVQNIGRGGGYALSVLWSLPLEIDMYVLLPFLYFFVRKNFVLWPLLLLWALACGLARPFLSLGNSFATVIPCFLPGVMAYVLFARIKPRIPSWAFPLFLAVLFAAFIRFSTVAASWPTCLLLGLGLPFFREMRFEPMKRLSREIAKYSYGAYLSHMVALYIAFGIFSEQTTTFKLPLAIGLTLLFTIIGYHLIEKPMILAGARIAAQVELRYEQRQVHSIVG
jgi:peptidoglycan/LPS O-acetylase OafA/YrhL